MSERFPRSTLTLSSFLPLVLGLVALLLAVACTRPEETGEEEPRLETVEVGESATSGMSWEEDARARRPRSEHLLGVLPSDVPRGLPLPEGAAVVDLGEEGERWLVLVVEAPASTVRQQLSRSWRAAGWSEGGDDVWSRGGERVRVTLEARGSGTRLRLDY